MKRLVIEVINGVEARIQVQTHKNGQFGRGSSVFIALNGFKFCSMGCPAQDESMHLYTRGSSTRFDGTTFLINPPDLDALREAVAEYNKTFKGEVEYEAII